MPTSPNDVLVRTVMQGVSGLATDVYVNDWAFRFEGVGPPDQSDLLELFGAVDGFYNDVQAAGNRVSAIISEAVSRSVTHEMQFFDISTGGSPIFTEPWLGPAAPASVNTNLPTEIASVLSFHGDLTGIPEEVGVTRPKARRRGRVYIGPLTTDAVTLTDDTPFLTPVWQTIIREAANSMYDEAEVADWRWSVWSRMADELYPVVGGWTDNAPDTQRRRGQESTARVTFTT